MRTSLLVPLLIAALLLLSLRPSPALEGLLERLASPARLLAEATWPVTRLGAVGAGREVHAAGGEAHESAEERAERELAASADMLRRWHASALPTRDELLHGRRAVPAEVLARVRGRRDQLVVRPWDLAGLEVGMPAVVRDAYAGRIAEVDRRRGEVRVDLVTGRDTLVGAIVLAEADRPAARVVVGGVATEGRRPAGGEPRTWLAAHHPSRMDLTGGRLRVEELLPALEPHGDLARGFDLGELVRGESDGDWRVEPELDFLHGLSHVVLLAPGGGAERLAQAPPHPLEEPLWARARLRTAGDPSPWRQTRQLDRGRGAGLVTGAAVVSGARLQGRIGSVAELGAEVRLLGDRGLVLGVLAEFPDHPEVPPRVLGRFVGLGRDPAGGEALFVWRDALPLADFAGGAGHVRARLYTAAGEAGLPSGLLIGEAELPVGPSGGSGHRVRLAVPGGVDGFAGGPGSAPVFVRRVAAGLGEPEAGP